jgi:thiol-disulfide isomerase/thioredoxin
MLSARLVFLSVFAATSALGQTAPNMPAESSDGLTLLQTMSQRYAAARSWYFVATQEVTEDSSIKHARHTVTMVAAVSGRKYHYEGSSGPQAAILVSDGTTAWDMRPNYHAWTENPLAPGGFENTGVDPGRQEDDANLAALLKNYGVAAGRFSSATRLPDATLVLNGVTIQCYVVEADEPQKKDPKNPGAAVTDTYWIDQANETLRKEKVRREQPAHNESVIEVTTTWQTVELDSPPPDALFHFTPPHGAERVAKFNDNPEDYGSMVGRTAPEVQVASPTGGGRVPISSYRGKVVLLDFWATWCGPCVESLPKLASLYAQAAAKGFVLLTVDEDKDAKKAAAFLAQHNYTWPNTQDEDGAIEDAYRSLALPHMLLIDAKGKIVYDDTGEDDNAIRKAVAGLGTEFAFLAAAQAAPKPGDAAHP